MIVLKEAISYFKAIVFSSIVELWKVLFYNPHEKLDISRIAYYKMNDNPKHNVCVLSINYLPFFLKKWVYAVMEYVCKDSVFYTEYWYHDGQYVMINFGFDDFMNRIELMKMRKINRKRIIDAHIYDPEFFDLLRRYMNKQNKYESIRSFFNESNEKDGLNITNILDKYLGPSMDFVGNANLLTTGRIPFFDIDSGIMIPKETNYIFTDFYFKKTECENLEELIDIFAIKKENK